MYQTESNPRILSIVSHILGNHTYGKLLKEYFETSPSTISVDFYWPLEERELFTRLLVKPLHTFFPNTWVQKQNLDFHRFRIEVALAYMTRRLLARKISIKSYSAMFLHTQVMSFLAVDFMKKIPTVISIDMTEAQASQENTDSSFRWTYAPNLFLEQQSFTAAAQIVAWSEWARKSLIEDYQIKEKKVKVIYPGVNIEKFIVPDQVKILTHKKFSILFVGGDFKRKGGQDVLEVFLQNFSDQAELNLVTRTPVQCNHPHVHIYDNINAYSRQWLDLYYYANVFVMPTYWEGTPSALVEAMAAGLPIISTNINSIPEIITEGETGFLVQPGDHKELADKIQYLIENPIIAYEMGVKGRKVAERKFNAQKNFQILESTFREVSLSK